MEQPMPGIPVLETTRLILRPLVDDDLHTLHEVHARGFGDGSEFNTSIGIDHARKVLQWIHLNEWFPRLRWWNTRAIVSKTTDKVIGEIAFVPMPLPLDAIIAQAEIDGSTAIQTMELSMLWGIIPEHRGQGYAAEAARAMIDFAFQQFNLRRIIADTEHANTASQSIMRKLGMTLYQSKLKGGDLDWIEVVGVLDNPLLKDK
jgi:RimJ/RimL family protein N-acetyltransferase